ncbi:hypothetical protein [Parasegetibacter sp. NRK P23]|uniref:hypothetical protein n=1 Tax=Parasegetibacter sp. NRK P23 TaxID=2942999 RepID=UPI002042D6A5|nr:hypothetical protein [Parasegetibacter sp. NRK P23]MCM5528391.1 hypothetical protein [Parasegetibacter sp. NRK P23]
MQALTIISNDLRTVTKFHFRGFDKVKRGVLLIRTLRRSNKGAEPITKMMARGKEQSYVPYSIVYLKFNRSQACYSLPETKIGKKSKIATDCIKLLNTWKKTPIQLFFN